MKALSESTQNLLNLLDEQTRQLVIGTLTAYESVLIDYENGKYKIGSLCVRDKYPSDFRVVGKIYNYDIFTKEEIDYNTKNL